jgi:hypothetical protein
MQAFSDSLRIIAAGYCLLLVVATALNVHRPLLVYPVRVIYSALRLTLEFVTRGHLHLQPVGRRVRRRGGTHLRNLGDAFREWREERAEAGGKVIEKPVDTSWASGHAEPVVAEQAEAAPTVCPIHGVPISTPLPFDERTGARNPEGTTHRLCAGLPEPAAAPRPVVPAPAAPAPQPVPAPTVAPPAPEPEPGLPAGGLPRPPVTSPWEDDEDVTPPPSFGQRSS